MTRLLDAGVGAGLLCCPACHGALVERERSRECGECARLYAVVDGLPVLLEDGAQHLARTAVRLHRFVARLDEDARELAEACWADSHAELRRACADALERKRALFSGFVAAIVAQLDPFAALADAAAMVDGDPALRWSYLDIERYLLRDWSGAEETEAELAGLRRAVFAQVDALAPERGLAVVLGAGTGRLAWDLRSRFRDVVALDDSLPMGLAFRQVVADGLTIQSVETSNVRSTADVVWGARLAPRGEPTPDATGSRVHYCIADGTRTPLPTGSADAVLSVYFTDVVPLPALLREVARILKPGGLFLHFGPLKRHGDRRWDLLLTPDVVLAELTRRGFIIGAQEWLRLSHRARPGALEQTVYDNWCLSARSPTTPRALGPGSVLALCRRAVITERSALTLAEDEPSLTLELPGIEASAVSSGVLALLRRVDGRRTVEQLLAGLAADGFRIDEDTAREIVAMLQQYVDLGLLAAVE